MKNKHKTIKKVICIISVICVCLLTTVIPTFANSISSSVYQPLFELDEIVFGGIEPIAGYAYPQYTFGGFGGVGSDDNGNLQQSTYRVIQGSSAGGRQLISKLATTERSLGYIQAVNNYIFADSSSADLYSAPLSWEDADANREWSQLSFKAYDFVYSNNTGLAYPYFNFSTTYRDNYPYIKLTRKITIQDGYSTRTETFIDYVDVRSTGGRISLVPDTIVKTKGGILITEYEAIVDPYIYIDSDSGYLQTETLFSSVVSGIRYVSPYTNDTINSTVVTTEKLFNDWYTNNTVVTTTEFEGDYVGWLVSAVESFMTAELFPGFTLGGVLGALISIFVAIWFLKVLAGG